MAGKGLVVPLTLNPRAWIDGIRVVDRSLERLEDSFDDVEDAGDRLERALADNLRDTEQDLRDAARAGQKLEDAFRDIARSSGREMGKVERDLDDVESEANQSAKEFGASFRGDPLEALEEVQAYLSEIIAVKLPGFAGAAATIAGGAALGAVVAGIEAWREKQERISQLATDYLTKIRETPGALSEITSQLGVQKVLEEATAEQFRDISKAAAERNLTVEDYVSRILSGEITTQDQLNSIVAERIRIQQSIEAYQLSGTEQQKAQIPLLQQQYARLGDQERALRNIGGYLNENVAGVGQAKDAAYEYQGALNLASLGARGLAANDFGRAAIEAAERAADRLNTKLSSPITKKLQITTANDLAARLVASGQLYGG